MSSEKLLKLLNHFYRTNLRYLPVVMGEKGEAGREKRDLADSLIGFISREKLNSVATDIKRARRDYKTIPESLLLTNTLPDDLITHLTQVDKLPVINNQGEKVAQWEASETLKAIAMMRERNRGEKKGITTGEVAKKSDTVAEPESRVDETSWLTKLILATIPHPLFVADLEGKTLFYNDAFKIKLLNHPKMKQSIRLVEEYLLELNRRMLTISFNEKEKGNKSVGDKLEGYLNELDLHVRIKPVEAESGLIGYLYLFEKPGDLLFVREAERLFSKGLGLDDIVDKIEKGIISRALSRWKQNISHTASFLLVKRTTLQNKMKRLRINEKIETKEISNISLKKPGATDALKKTTTEKMVKKKKNPVKKKKSSR